MLLDNGIIAVFNDSAENTVEDFESIMEGLNSSNALNGLYTIFFSRYFDYKIITEVLLILKYNTEYIFIDHPISYNMLLNNQLDMYSFAYDNSQTFIKLFSKDYTNLLGEFYTDKGNLLDIYCLSDDDGILFGNKWVKEQIDLIDDLIIPLDEEFEEISKKYLEIRKEKFQLKLNEVIAKDEPYDGFDTNPFSQVYYDGKDSE